MHESPAPLVALSIKNEKKSVKGEIILTEKQVICKREKAFNKKNICFDKIESQFF